MGFSIPPFFCGGAALGFDIVAVTVDGGAGTLVVAVLGPACALLAVVVVGVRSAGKVASGNPPALRCFRGVVLVRGPITDVSRLASLHNWQGAQIFQLLI